MKLLIAAAVGIAAGYLFRRYQPNPATRTVSYGSYPWPDATTPPT